MTGPQNVNFKPENGVPTTQKEITEDQKFSASVQKTLQQAKDLLAGKVATADASNVDGDTLHISGSKTEKPATTQKIYSAFRIGVDKVKNLINTSDGMKPYDASTGWGSFPERGIVDDPKSQDAKAVEQVQWGKGLNDDYTPHSSVEGVDGEKTFVKGKKDGGIDGQERDLTVQQLVWDRSKGMNLNAGGNAENLLHSVIDSSGNVRPEFDTNNNKVFDAQDAETLAKVVDETVDGTPVLSSEDLDKVSSDLIMDGVKHRALGTAPKERSNVDMSVYKGDFTGQQTAQYLNYASQTPENQINNATQHTLTIDEAHQAHEHLTNLSTLRDSNPQQFKQELAKTGISEKNFDQVLNLSSQMVANDGLLLDAISNVYREGVENAASSADFGFAINTKEPEVDPHESSDFFYFNNNEIKHVINNFGR